MDLFDLLQQNDFLPKNETIVNSFIKAYSIINRPQYNTILCSVSGGSDSDIMLDVIYKADVTKKVIYIWIDTGLECAATKNHLDYLENKYKIVIKREKAVKPVAVSCKEYGQPFISKNVSQRLERLQKKGFDFQEHNYEYMLTHYGKDLAQWWCNLKDNSCFNINQNLFLKDFLIVNPPSFSISSRCCDFAKKDVSKELIRKYKADLMVIGVRQAEGGGKSYSL